MALRISARLLSPRSTAPCVGSVVSLLSAPSSSSATWSTRLCSSHMLSRRLAGQGTLCSSFKKCFGTSVVRQGLMPESGDPPVREAEEHDSPDQPCQLSIEEYHEQADALMDKLMARLEARQEEKNDLDADYSAGVMTIEMHDRRSYVLNKQPPNKQIWLSSPVSGPKRFDWVMSGESMNEKEGTGVGEWVYIRDGTRLIDLLNKELGIGLSPDDVLLEEAEVVARGSTVQS